MRNYNSIDLMKFVMALCVVTIHTYIVDGMNPSFLRDILHSLIRNAVPFFFIPSSFFIMKRERSSLKVNEKVLLSLPQRPRFFRLYFLLQGS